MGLFGTLFGKPSRSTSTQTSTSNATSFGENFSSSLSEQGSDSFSVSGSQSGQTVYQDPYLQQLYAGASSLLNNYGMPNRQVAGINPALATGLGQQFGFSQGGGQDIYNAQLMSSLGNLGGFGNAQAAANRMASGGAYGTPMTNGLNMTTLGASVNNPYLDGQIDAASRDVVRNLNENQLTGNASNAAATMNSGSSRRAVMDAIAQRGAADRVADISSNMRGAAYSQGLGLANQTALANQSAALNTNALNAGLMGQGANLNFQLGQAGAQGLQAAYGTGVNNAQLATDTGNYLRQYQQQVLDTAFQNQMNPYTSLQMYQSLIGGPTTLSSSNSFSNSGSTSFGGSVNNSYGYDGSQSNSYMTGTSRSTGPSQGLMQSLGQVAGAVAMGGMGGFCWVAREVYGENNPKWLKFREWMFAEAPMWFFDLYGKYGESFAAWIKNKPILKAAIRKWMDGRVAAMA